jgi:leucyl aminopeptidase
MEINVVAGSIQEQTVDAIVVNWIEGVQIPSGATKAVDSVLGGAIQELVQGGDFGGRLGEVAVLYPRTALPAQRVLVVGLGPGDSLDLEAVRRASAEALKRLRQLNARQVASIVHGAGAAGLGVRQAAQATVEGALLGLYRLPKVHQQEQENYEIQTLTLVEFDAQKLEAVQAGANLAQVVAQGVALARDLVNLPPNVATPTHMAQTAERIAAEQSMHLTIGDRTWAAERKMGGFLAVASGAGEEPRFIVLEHNRGRTDLDTLVLVGKGITFDSGGVSLKPAEKMWQMKSDMGGAAAVLGTMQAVGKLGLPLHVVGIAPCTENMPDGHAYHPADVITASNGKTIEIISTDAEGRMVLADGLVYAAQYKPKAVVDLATLTSSCVIALGDGVAGGIFSTDDGLRDALLDASQRTHERLWPMPLFDDYRHAIRSLVADMKNSGGKTGGVGTSAAFLREFTSYPWAHLDIAPVALVDKERAGPYIPVGGSGFGVRLLVDFLLNWSGIEDR